MSTVEKPDVQILYLKKGDERLCPHANFSQSIVSAVADDRDLTGASFHGTRFLNLSARNTILTEADFLGARIDQADFRGANLTRVRDLDTVHGLQNAKFDENTILDELDLTRIAIPYPLETRRLRQLHYVGKLKRKRPILYWAWQLSCGCGRSWAWLLFWGLVAVVIFGEVYIAGTFHPDVAWLPHLEIIGTTPTSPSILSCFEFSALTFVGFNMPNISWADDWTGAWVAVQAWAGLAFVGVFITVIATKMAENE